MEGLLNNLKFPLQDPGKMDLLSEVNSWEQKLQHEYDSLRKVQDRIRFNEEIPDEAKDKFRSLIDDLRHKISSELTVFAKERAYLNELSDVSIDVSEHFETLRHRFHKCQFHVRKFLTNLPGVESLLDISVDAGRHQRSVDEIEQEKKSINDSGVSRELGDPNRETPLNISIENPNDNPRRREIRNYFNKASSVTQLNTLPSSIRYPQAEDEAEVNSQTGGTLDKFKKDVNSAWFENLLKQHSSDSANASFTAGMAPSSHHHTPAKKQTMKPSSSSRRMLPRNPKKSDTKENTTTKRPTHNISLNNTSYERKRSNSMNRTNSNKALKTVTNTLSHNATLDKEGLSTSFDPTSDAVVPKSIKVLCDEFVQLKGICKKLMTELEIHEHYELEKDISAIKTENAKLKSDLKLMHNEHSELMHTVHVLNKKFAGLEAENGQLRRDLQTMKVISSATPGSPMLGGGTRDGYSFISKQEPLEEEEINRSFVGHLESGPSVDQNSSFAGTTAKKDRQSALMNQYTASPITKQLATPSSVHDIETSEFGTGHQTHHLRSRSRETTPTKARFLIRQSQTKKASDMFSVLSQHHRE
eukprot:CAMPEP_0114998944 /NCGR_PEP_ID=MMETSP0216-20121206/15837_1 /TAXON_ID=223996 /ORGANISM="Protocruzia adherens, Strain Boccale" /LENGTH=585 /DNA_ID=CAMNT_0002363695 /DNA_START=32 /DNA_END=1789 /DNA_ORIENTATION=+